MSNGWWWREISVAAWSPFIWTQLTLVGNSCPELVFCLGWFITVILECIKVSSLLQGLLFVSSNSGLVEVPVANCSNYLSCGECVLSRDPYCAWTGRLCRDVRMAPPDRWEISYLKAFTYHIKCFRMRIFLFLYLPGHIFVTKDILQSSDS